MTRHTLEILNKLEEETRSKALVDLEVDGTFQNVLKGAFIKCFEFALLCNSSEPLGHAFFLAPSLRGICEDFIVLRFLRQKRSASERDQLLTNKAIARVVEATEKQKRFFNTYRPFQPVFQFSMPFSPAPSGLPPIRNMAKEIGLDNLYDFMYAVTSDVVHFNPRVIIRNAWGQDKARFEHSVKNFTLYYFAFCRVYSLFFLCKVASAFRAELDLSDAFCQSMSELERNLNEELRWPEAVTFEEMNVDGPREIIRILLKAAYEEHIESVKREA